MPELGNCAACGEPILDGCACPECPRCGITGNARCHTDPKHLGQIIPLLQEARDANARAALLRQVLEDVAQHIGNWYETIGQLGDRLGRDQIAEPMWDALEQIEQVRPRIRDALKTTARLKPMADTSRMSRPQSKQIGEPQ